MTTTILKEGISRDLNQALSDDRLKNQINDLVKRIELCQRLMGWIKTHADKLDGLTWLAMEGSGTIFIRESSRNPNPREIVRRFPGAVFKRVAASGKCGVCDWVGTFEDVQITIAEAEKMEWRPALNSPVE